MDSTEHTIKNSDRDDKW